MSSVNENSSKPVFIDIYFNELKLGSATGFQIQNKQKYLVTNWHVVSGKNFITNQCLNDLGAIPNKLILKYKRYIDDGNYEWIDKTIHLYDLNENKIWHEHPIFGSKVDVVLVPLEEEANKYSYKECFRDNTNYILNVTENIFVLGFPLGYTVKSKEEPHAVWTSGTVASDPILNLIINGDEVPAFLIDSRTRQGQSGSPVIYYSQQGLDLHYETNRTAIWGCPFMQEVGIYSGRINKDSDLGYVWKWQVIKEIIESIKTK